MSSPGDWINIGNIKSRPILGDNPNRRTEPKLAIIAYYDPNGINTVYENIANWQQFSRFNIHVINLWPNYGASSLALPSTLNLRDFEAVILHPTVSYFPDNLMNLDTALDVGFKEYDGIKVLVKQDEHYRSGAFPNFIAANKFDVLVTCVPPDEIEKVYPKSVVGDIRIIHALTGYVSPQLLNLPIIPYADRKIDISYRGSIQPLSIGRLGFEKRRIGNDILRATSQRSIKTDISSRWEHRVSGQEWFNFLANSKIVLGVESGSNLFDFDGKVEQWCNRFAKANPDLNPDTDEYYYQAHEQYLHNFEGNVNYAQIGPRHFEAAAVRSVQLLYEGQYSNIFIPDKHYLPLKRDLSNLEENLEILKDERRARQLTDAAYEEVILNKENHYATFVTKVDSELECLLPVHKKHSVASSAKLKAAALKQDKPQKALVVMSHDPQLDPRIDWVSKGFVKRGFEVVEIGTHRIDGENGGPTIEVLGPRHKRVRLERRLHNWEAVANPGNLDTTKLIGEHHILLYMTFGFLPIEFLASRIGALDTSNEELLNFRWYCRNNFHCNSAILEASRRIGKFDVVVSADLDVLPSALTLANESNSICVFDAHEYWPAAVSAKTHWQYEFWANIEKNLSNAADVCMTVSPQLAKHMEMEYGVPFLSVPNCEPSTSTSENDHLATESNVDGSLECNEDKVVFLFQGNFHPDRPVDKLIKAWNKTDNKAQLWLRGPDGPYKFELITLATKLGLCGTRVLFPNPVSEEELVSAAGQADVGIIPYTTEKKSYQYACPNKLSQYMAAGLPILTSPIDYVAETVTDNDLGLVYDLNSPESIAQQVNTFVNDRNFRLSCARRAKQYFVEKFNWDIVSTPFYQEVAKRLEHREVVTEITNEELNFDWIESGNAMNEERVFIPPALDAQASEYVSTQLSAKISGKSAIHSLALITASIIPAPARNFIKLILPVRVKNFITKGAVY